MITAGLERGDEAMTLGWCLHGPVGLLVVALAALAAACGSSVAGSPTSQLASPTSAPTTSPSAPATPHACTVETDGRNVDISGDSVSSTFGDGGVTFSCGGPTLAVGKITSMAVTLDLSGASVTVAVGTAGTVGPYQVTVVGISRGTATMQITTSP